jgi:CubicO group peptidase (beta-lactamase class C family)
MDETLPRAVALIRGGMAQGLHIGAQVYVSVDGEPVADFGLGEARRGVPMTGDTIMPWLSCTKPVAAVAMAQLWNSECFDLDDPVCNFIPEFGARGKEAVTLRHILTHTGGFRSADLGSRVASRDEILSRICAAPLEPGWVPGRRAGYHVLAGWDILGEVVACIDRRPFEQFAREAIFEPLGMEDCWTGLTGDPYRAYGDRMGILYNTEGAAPEPNAWDTEEWAACPRPGDSGRGPMRELGRFYEMLLCRGERQGARILWPQAVEAITARHRTGMFDHTFRHVMDWGLGFVVDSNQYGWETVPYGFGRHCSPRTFGHGGRQSSVGFCDPEFGLVAALVCNGTPGEARHNERMRAILTALYEDLGFSWGTE